MEEVTIQYADWSSDHLLIIRDVPALRCKTNGHEYVLEEVLDQIESLLELERAHRLKPAETMEVPVFSLRTAA